MTELLRALDSRLHETYWEWCEKSQERRKAMKAKKPTGDIENDSSINHRISMLVEARGMLGKVTDQLRRLALA